MKTRAFIAINLPLEIKKEIKKIIDELKRAGGNVKWVEPENIHLTLHFLGWLEEEKIKEVKKILEENTKEIKSCLIEIKGLDYFPTRTSPRVIFLEGDDKNNNIRNLRAKIGEGLEAIGIEIDKRPFRLHFTLGRVKEKGFRLPQTKISTNLSFEVRSIELMKSQLMRTGPVYSVIESFPFH